MGQINVKVPDEQKEQVERIAKKYNYPSSSEYVREAIRDKIEKHLRLSEKAKEAIDEAREQERDIPLEQIADS